MRIIILNIFFTLLLVFCTRQYDLEDAGIIDYNSNEDIGLVTDTNIIDLDDRGSLNKFRPVYCNKDIKITSKKLREKAEYFDKIARELHIPKGQELLFSVFVREDSMTFDKVVMSDNVGTWTALYTASQAFRYATTKEKEALENLKTTLKGQHNLLKITGVRGLFTRIYVNPKLPGFPSAEQLNNWYPDCDLSVKHCKRFVEVEDGEFKGYFFKTDVSKDEYAHHMFSMSVLWNLIDDTEVKSIVRDIVQQVADHLMENNLRIIDIDGKVTTFGRMYATAFDDFPGFNALLTLSWFKLASVVGGEKYLSYYKNCLLQKRGRYKCIKDEEPTPYTDYLNNIGLNLDCKTNWNNHNMAQISMFHLIQNEDDRELNKYYKEILYSQLWNANDPRPMRAQQNTLYTFFFAINKPENQRLPTEELSDAICVMQMFPERKHQYAVDTLNRYKTVCYDRSNEPLTDIVIPINEYGMDNFLWIRNPYKLKIEPENLFLIESPEDYLLAYWIGRYYGFIDENM
ncbi:MAG: hypothetical protein N2746_06980 [Deltaproteobacteria bacterium]|nr:hypothetical protein [Deltaproteobacteria bacterium]